MSNFQQPRNLWIASPEPMEMTRDLYNAFGEMLDSEEPMGLVTAATNIDFLTYEICDKEAIAPLTCSSFTARYSSKTSRLR